MSVMSGGLVTTVPMISQNAELIKIGVVAFASALLMRFLLKQWKEPSPAFILRFMSNRIAVISLAMVASISFSMTAFVGMIYILGQTEIGLLVSAAILFGTFPLLAVYLGVGESRPDPIVISDLLV
jgi:hypothetical protein